MKAKLKIEQQIFEPVTIEITFETKEEMKAFKSLTKYAPVTQYFRNVGISLVGLNDIIPCKSHLENDGWGDFVKLIEGK